MRKTLATLATTGAIALGGLSASPQPANAVAWWVAPAIAGGVILGAAGGAAAAGGYYGRPYAAAPYAYAPEYDDNYDYDDYAPRSYGYAPRSYGYAPRSYRSYSVPAQPYDAYASDEVYVRRSVAPRNCFWARQRVPGGWQRVRMCDR